MKCSLSANSERASGCGMTSRHGPVRLRLEAVTHQEHDEGKWKE
jgi:hypothetical protein